MIAKKVMEIWPRSIPEAKAGHDVYAHGQVMFEGDDRDLVLVACRAWCWDKIGDKSGYIRHPPSIDQDFDTKVWRSRARISVLMDKQWRSQMDLNEAMSIVIADSLGEIHRDPDLRKQYSEARRLVVDHARAAIGDARHPEHDLQPPPDRHMRAYRMTNGDAWKSLTGDEKPPSEALVWYVDTTVWQLKHGKPVRRIVPSPIGARDGLDPTPQDYTTGYREAMEVAGKELDELGAKLAARPELSPLDCMCDLRDSFLQRIGAGASINVIHASVRKLRVGQWARIVDATRWAYGMGAFKIVAIQQGPDDHKRKLGFEGIDDGLPQWFAVFFEVVHV